MWKFPDKKGMAMITILTMTVILVMLITALVAINSNNLLYSLNYIHRVSALSVAETGVVYAIYALQDDPHWQPPQVVYPTKTGKFTITFDSSMDSHYFSVNNLNPPSMKIAGGGAGGKDVEENTVDLIVTGQSGDTIKRLRVILGRTTIGEAARLSGMANIEAGEFKISRVTTPLDPTLGGSFHSNSSDPNAIMTSDDTMVYAYGGVITAVGGIDIPNYDVANGTQIRSGVEVKPLPEIDINSIVTDASTNPSVHTMQGGTYEVRQNETGGPYELFLPDASSPVTLPYNGIDLTAEGKLVFTEDVYFQNDVRFNFITEDNNYKEVGIKLEDDGTSYPSLYINGSDPNTAFWVLGKVEGNGSIYNKGGTKFIMETDVTGGEETGTTLFCEKNININLPASRVAPISLQLTGAILTHGNLNASIMDTDHPDNPINSLPEEDAWPNNWVEQAYNGAGSFAAPAAYTVDIPASGLSMSYSGHTLKFVPDGISSILPGQVSSQIVSSTATLTINGNGTYTFGGDANFIHIYYDGYSCDQDTANGWVTRGTTVGDGTGDLHLDYWRKTAGSLGHYVTRNMFASNQSAFCNYVFHNLEYYESTHPPAAGPTPVPTPSGPVYAPDVLITGAFLVADPNNLDGSGPPDPNAGNINVDLIPPDPTMDKGNFNLTHSKKYEKLLADQEINLKIVVHCWEEMK